MTVDVEDAVGYANRLRTEALGRISQLVSERDRAIAEADAAETLVRTTRSRAQSYSDEISRLKTRRMAADDILRSYGVEP